MTDPVNSGTHLSLNPSLLTSIILDASFHTQAAKAGWKRAQALKNVIVATGGDPDLGQLVTDTASLCPSGKQATLAADINFFADTFDGIAEIERLSQS